MHFSSPGNIILLSSLLYLPVFFWSVIVSPAKSILIAFGAIIYLPSASGTDTGRLFLIPAWTSMLCSSASNYLTSRAKSWGMCLFNWSNVTHWVMQRPLRSCACDVVTYASNLPSYRLTRTCGSVFQNLGIENDLDKCHIPQLEVWHRGRFPIDVHNPPEHCATSGVNLGGICGGDQVATDEYMCEYLDERDAQVV